MLKCLAALAVYGAEVYLRTCGSKKQCSRDFEARVGNDIVGDTRQDPDGFVRSEEWKGAPPIWTSAASLGKERHLMKAPAMLVTCHQTYTYSQRPFPPSYDTDSTRTTREAAMGIVWLLPAACESSLCSRRDYGTALLLRGLHAWLADPRVDAMPR